MTDYLCQNAEKFGDKDALVFAGQSISWLELWRRVQTASSELLGRLGSRRPAVVAILAPNSLDFVVSFLAVVDAGHIAMPLDVTFKKLELDSVIKAAKPDLVLARREMSGLAGGNCLLIEDLLAAKPRGAIQKLREPADNQVAILFMSSGTTGRPKIIPNTHNNILWDVKAISEPMGWTANDTLLITLHLSHRHGLVICLMGAIYHGNTVYLEERFNPKTALAMLESGKISLYSAVPSIYESLVSYRPEAEFDLSGVRLFASSSSALPPYLHQAFKHRFGSGILDRYGTSETGSIAIRSPDAKDGFDILLDGVKLQLEASGDVALKSPGLFPGYYKNSAATRRNQTSDGWWLIGDIGEIHGSRLVLKGRSKERISKTGYSIYPQDIEWALRQNQKVKEVKVVGQSVKNRIDDIVVAIYAGHVSEESLRDYSKENLPRSWRPDVYIQLESIPKTRNGKPSLVSINKLLSARQTGLAKRAKV